MHSLPQDFQRWKFDLRSICGQFDARGPMTEDFRGRAERHVFGDLEIARIQSNALSIARARHHHSDGKDYCFLVLQMAGHQHLCCDGLEPASIYPGDLMLLDPCVPFEMLPHGLTDNFSVHLPRHLIAEHIPARAVGGKLRGDWASTRMLSALLRQLADLEPAYIATQAESVALRESLIKFLLPSLRLEGDGDALEGLGDEVYRAALRQIRSHLASPQLNADWLATRLRVSRRQLYRSFAAQGHAGIAQFILACRLERGAQLLRDEQRCGQSIGSVAMEVGLGDITHFSRVFRRQYQMTPSRYRTAAAV